MIAGMSRRTTNVGTAAGIVLLSAALHARPAVADVHLAPITLDKCVSGGRPPTDCRLIKMEVAETEERELRELIARARVREARETQSAERDGKVTGGVWGFVSYSYRLRFSDGKSQRYAWLHVSTDAAWLEGDAELRVVFNRAESKELAKVVARLREKEEGNREPAIDPSDILPQLSLGIQWQAADSIDFNCDLARDHVFVGSDTSHYYVALIVTPLSKDSVATYVKFVLAGDSQDALCGTTPSLHPESLDADLLEILGAEPEGWRRTRMCLGMRLESGDCDSFHLYWNKEQAKLDWWRL
jgi:hypothetical protein